MIRPEPQSPFSFILCSHDKTLRRQITAVVNNLAPINIIKTPHWTDCTKLLPDDRPAILILDADPWEEDDQSPWLSRVASLQTIDRRIIVIMLSPSHDAENAIAAVGHGCFEYLIKPVESKTLTTIINDALRIVKQSSFSTRPGQSISDNNLNDTQIATTDQHAYRARLIGRSAPMMRVYKQIGQAASSAVQVLITGELGTGKELVARALHDNSPRKNQPFIAINCAAIPDNLLESELFGHEKGAFTGADRKRIGQFEQAAGGTILLDEIGDMSPMLQAKMLRLVQDRSFYRVGGNELLHADVRILAATHQPLEERIATGHFRADLFYRLRVVLIHLEPLRNRDVDIILLAHHFAALYSRELNRHITAFHPETNKHLLNHTWPGNVRELQNVIKQAIVVAHGSTLLPEFLPPLVPLPSYQNSQTSTHQSPTSISTINQSSPTTTDPASPQSIQNTPDSFCEHILIANDHDAYAVARRELDRSLIQLVLALHHGNRSAAARHLGITRLTLQRKIEASTE